MFRLFFRGGQFPFPFHPSRGAPFGYFRTVDVAPFPSLVEPRQVICSAQSGRVSLLTGPTRPWGECLLCILCIEPLTSMAMGQEIERRVLAEAIHRDRDPWIPLGISQYNAGSI